MDLKELNNLESLAAGARREATLATERAQHAAKFRGELAEPETKVSLECKISDWVAPLVRKKFSDAVLEHAPSIFRMIELREQAEAKRLTAQAEIFEAQITAAIL